MIFEEFEFAAYYRSAGWYQACSSTAYYFWRCSSDRVLGPVLNCYNDVQSLFNNTSGGGKSTAIGATDFLLVIDSGFSHTTVTPVVKGRPIHDAVRRLDIGGKHLTNYLTELLAIHEISLKEDPWIANEVKEATCFVSDNFRRDMERTWRAHEMDPPVAVDVQLPDYQEYFKAIARPYSAKDQASKSKANIATLGNERFQVPELLFNPNDVGMHEAGLPELVLQSVGILPEGLRPDMLANILVVGGNARIPGFVERL
jgi:actin-related protein 6